MLCPTSLGLAGPSSSSSSWTAFWWYARQATSTSWRGLMLYRIRLSMTASSNLDALFLSSRTRFLQVAVAVLAEELKATTRSSVVSSFDFLLDISVAVLTDIVD